MGDLMAKKDYDLTEITRLLLKMRDNCVQKEGEMYNDPERQEKYEALQAAIDLINNPSHLIEAEPMWHGRWMRHKPNGITWTLKCSECNWVDNRATLSYKFNYCPNCGKKMNVEETE